jgi:hypothetical protein
MKQNSEDEQALIKSSWREIRLTDTFIKQNGEWKVVASQVTPVLKK